MRTEVEQEQILGEELRSLKDVCFLFHRRREFQPEVIANVLRRQERETGRRVKVLYLSPIKRMRYWFMNRFPECEAVDPYCLGKDLKDTSYDIVIAHDKDIQHHAKARKKHESAMEWRLSLYLNCLENATRTSQMPLQRKIIVFREGC